MHFAKVGQYSKVKCLTVFDVLMHQTRDYGICLYLLNRFSEAIPCLELYLQVNIILFRIICDLCFGAVFTWDIKFQLLLDPLFIAQLTQLCFLEILKLFRGFWIMVVILQLQEAPRATDAEAMRTLLLKMRKDL